MAGCHCACLFHEIFLCHPFHHSFFLSSYTLLVTQQKAVGLLNIALCHGLCCVVFVMNCLHFLRPSTHTILIDCVTSLMLCAAFLSWITFISHLINLHFFSVMQQGLKFSTSFWFSTFCNKPLQFSVIVHSVTISNVLFWQLNSYFCKNLLSQLRNDIHPRYQISNIAYSISLSVRFMAPDIYMTYNIW